MITVNSLSGGKTSSYLAAHFPADIDLFSLVCIDCHNAGGFIDKKLKQRVNDRLQKSIPGVPEFLATAEDVKSLTAVLDLEQHIGRDITWVRSHLGFESLIQYEKKMIPNKSARFCTYILKIVPIFEYLYMRNCLPCEMRIGYRADEIERRDSFTESIKYPKASTYHDNPNSKGRKGRFKEWEEIEWLKGHYPLIDNYVTHGEIIDYWGIHNIEFPEDSNCLFCYWKTAQQLRKNFDTQLPTMAWAMIMEAMMDARFKKELALADIQKIGIQLGFQYGGGAGCQAGFCTD